MEMEYKMFQLKLKNKQTEKYFIARASYFGLYCWLNLNSSYNLRRIQHTDGARSFFIEN